MPGRKKNDPMGSSWWICWRGDFFSLGFGSLRMRTRRAIVMAPMGRLM
jgi:hypothetical protein